MLPAILTINTFTLSTYYIFGFIGFLFSLFIVWYEAKRDGFELEKALDIFFVSFGAAALSGYFFKLEIAYFVFWLIVYIWAKHINWSHFRLYDIFSTALYIEFIWVFAGLILTNSFPDYSVQIYLFSLVLLVLFIFGFLFRVKLTSGFTFSLSTIVAGSGLFLLFRSVLVLPFYISLFTISIVTLYLRQKSMSSLPQTFIDRMKSLLKRKNAQLEAEQKSLLDKDPYLAPGRTEENEILDDVNEDLEKELYDKKVNFIRSLQSQVQRALARMRAGKYGVCEVCGKEIGKERLEALPEATRCVQHAE